MKQVTITRIDSFHLMSLLGSLQLHIDFLYGFGSNQGPKQSPKSQEPRTQLAPMVNIGMIRVALRANLVDLVAKPRCHCRV